MIEKKMSLLIAGLLFVFPSFAQEETYTAPAEEIAWAKQFSGISGPGEAVEGDGRGGWRSGSSGVMYYGNNPRPEYKKGDLRMCSGSAVNKGLVPPIRPAWELHLRDGVVTLGGDGNYYLTGSSGDNIWAWAKGIELWKSKDLHSWEYVGLGKEMAQTPASGRESCLGARDTLYQRELFHLFQYVSAWNRNPEKQYGKTRRPLCQCIYHR